MHSARMLALAGLVAFGLSATVQAEEPAKALPTLLIKGEVVSVDNSDAQAVLVKVRDRYGFETPIFVSSDSKVTQGDAPVQIAVVAAGSGVEVEYNFDVNTAKRHAVSVKLTQAKTSASAPAVEPAAAATPATTQPAEAAPAAPASEAAPAATTAPTATDAAPATQ